MTQRQPTSFSFDTLRQFVLQLFDVLRHRVRPAALAIALFLGVVFTFAVKGGTFEQSAQVAMLPELEVVADRGDTLSVAEAAVQEAEASYVVGAGLEKMEPLPPQQVDTETLWLARVIYSETKRPQEQELVAWVVRNRVETGYRGNDSYQEAVLDPYQFSAFNPGTRTRNHYANLAPTSSAPGFKNAVAIAKQVKEAPETLRPFPETTRHFFSEQSMVGGRHPNWARGKSPVTPERPLKLDAERFRFYANVG